MARNTQSKVVVLNKTVTRDTYYGGKLVERVVETPIKVVRGSIKHKKAETYKLIEDKVKALEISPWAGEAIAQIIKNSKRKYRWKKPPKIIPCGDAEQRFKRTWLTDANENTLMRDILSDPEKYGLDDDRKKDISERMKEIYYSYWIDFPKDALRFTEYRKMIPKNEYRLRHWCAAWKNVPEWQLDKTPIEELKKFFEEKCEAVDKRLASKTSQVNPNG